MRRMDETGLREKKGRLYRGRSFTDDFDDIESFVMAESELTNKEFSLLSALAKAAIEL
jgi:hypothetical protein